MRGLILHCCALVPIWLLPAGTQRLQAQTPAVLELAKNWELIPADKVSGAGDIVSQESYQVKGGYPVHRMPATVLDVLQENRVYPDLFYGRRLLESVPQDLYRKDWWYRTTFNVAAGGNTFWLDFSGINYRAEMWLNGKLVAGKKQTAGMYVDHTFNVTEFIEPGRVNTLAVKVTPEQAIQGLDGVELSDSWFDWINWKYLGYKGVLDPRKIDLSAYTARYIAPDQKAASLSVSIRVQAAATSGITLVATVTPRPDASPRGKVDFFREGGLLGTSDVQSDGTASIVTPLPEGISFVADRNAGIWKPVRLSVTGAVRIVDLYVKTELPLPDVTPAALTVYTEVENGSASVVTGRLIGNISRAGKKTLSFDQAISLKPGERREVSFPASAFPQLLLRDADLWWPYTLGRPDLYRLHLRFVTGGNNSDERTSSFGIRQITQFRDQDEKFPGIGKGGNFYLKINGRNMLIRGAVYTPNLLFHTDHQREADEISYIKDLGLNMIRWESKISSEHMIDLADEAGIPMMFGWMCCNQWEKWDQWDAEDHSVARASLQSQIRMLRGHAAAFIWANGSDGYPPEGVLDGYHEILRELHWQNAVVDTVSSYARDKNGERRWNGIHMEGPYSWRPPSYWFAGRYAAAQGACAEQGDNENVPPLASIRKFTPEQSLWPINDTWFFHAGANNGNNVLLNTRNAVERRYGPSRSAAEFSSKAQLGLYENTRAQFEDFAANGWADHKMTLYWMLNSAWPSYFGHLYDFYLRPGGAYYGAKKGLQPLSAVFDYYAAGDHTHATIKVVNQTLAASKHMRLRTRIYDLGGHVLFDKSRRDIDVDAQSVSSAMTLPKIDGITSAYFVRCELFNSSDQRVVENTYWQSTTLDDLGEPQNDNAFELKQSTWSDFTALNTMPKVALQASGSLVAGSSNPEIDITLSNPTEHVAFFERVEVTEGKDANELLPIRYSDNYITVFPGETVQVKANVMRGYVVNKQLAIRVEGYNSAQQSVPVR